MLRRKEIWVREERYEVAQRRKIVQISLCVTVKQFSMKSRKEGSQENRVKTAKKYCGPT